MRTSTVIALQGFADRVDSGEYAVSLDMRSKNPKTRVRGRQISVTCADGRVRSIDEAAAWEKAEKLKVGVTEYRSTSAGNTTVTTEFINRTEADKYVYSRIGKLNARGWYINSMWKSKGEIRAIKGSLSVIITVDNK